MVFYAPTIPEISLSLLLLHILGGFCIIASLRRLGAAHRLRAGIEIENDKTDGEFINLVWSYNLMSHRTSDVSQSESSSSSSTM